MKLILLVNLGSPTVITKSSIRKFLGQFLVDKRVINLPRILWLPILFGVILPFRSKKLIHKYQQVWINGSSPLHFYTKEQATKLQLKLPSVSVVHAFCYGDNNIKQVLDKHTDINQLVVLPLYPQYASSTTASVYDQISNYYADKFYLPSIKFINSFADNPLYIQALANQVLKFWELNGKADKLVISFHSVPQKMIEQGDKYLAQCQVTFDLLCKKLQLQAGVDALICFQSKFGRAKWLEPATSQITEELAKSGIRSIDVICPGFMADCLETLEEIQLQYKELFINSGGRQLNYIPCLNDNDDAIDLLKELVNN